VLSTCDPAARVPGCPAWDAADLLWHLTGVQAFWGSIILDRPAGPDEVTAPERASTYDGLLAAFDNASERLADALAAATPDDKAWSWSADQTVGFSYRRQAQEALIHRLDAEQTAGAVTPMDPTLSADGVLEILDMFYSPCPPWAQFFGLPHHVRIDVTDTGDTFWVQLGRRHGIDPDGVEHDEDALTVVGDPGGDADAVVSGPAAVLNTRLWRRGDGDALHLAGDLSMVDHFRNAIHHPIG
jgi:uncharacterized protein (TIGR03083 family)